MSTLGRMRKRPSGIAAIDSSTSGAGTPDLSRNTSKNALLPLNANECSP
jgi:hypothetical protein